MNEGWTVHIIGPDAEGLMWISIGKPGDGAAAFSAPVESVRGEILKRAQKKD